MSKKIFISVSVACMIFTSWVLFTLFVSDKYDPSLQTVLPSAITAEELGQPETPEQALGQSIAMISVVSAWCASEQPDPLIKALSQATLDRVVKVGYVIIHSKTLDEKSKEEITKATALFGDKLIRALEDGHAFAEGTCSERTFQKFNSLLDSVEQAAVKTNVQHI
tara:strand:- start:952 stop:1449 length:498 start_codon:yes stop_codon:yes gene_type:complete